MSDTAGEPEGPAGAPALPRVSAERVPVASRWRRRSLTLVVAIVLAGVISGLVWHLAVQPPVYKVGFDGSATISESALSRLFTIDAWFVLIGLLVGMGLGTLVWKLAEPLGWPVALLAAVAGFLAGVVCWQVGQFLGPRHFADRLAAVGAEGGLVPLDFALRAKSALLVWPIGALLPVLLYGASETLTSRRIRRVRPGAVASASRGDAAGPGARVAP